MVDREHSTCRFCGAEQVAPEPVPAEVGAVADGVSTGPTPSAVSYPPPPMPPRMPQGPDRWFPHFLKFAGAYGAVWAAGTFVIGWFWIAHILNRTGYRRRDVLLLLVPIVNVVMLFTALWRYTAKQPYWSPRTDRQSLPLTGTLRPTVIFGGYVAAPLVSIMLFATFLATHGWNDANRNELVDGFMREGLDQSTSQCVVRELEVAYPVGPPPESDPRLIPVVRDAVTRCSGPAGLVQEGSPN